MLHAIIRHHIRFARARGYATFNSSGIISKPPPPTPSNKTFSSELDSRLLSALTDPFGALVPLPVLVQQYHYRAGHVLSVPLPYESRPAAHRRVNVSALPAESGLAMIAHCARDDDSGEHKITLASGFALEAPAERQGESLILTCAHTLEEIRRSRLVLSGRNLTTGSFLILPSLPLALYPITSVQSSLPHSDLILFSCPAQRMRTLPVSPYAVHSGTRVVTHLIHDTPPHRDQASPPHTTTPFLPTLHSAWTPSTVAGYRDLSGREAYPGTYDALSHLLFEPVPTSGSSGGPVIDEETGAVIGVVLGSRMDFGSKMRGWGVPSEAIFEMFSLPGLAGKK